MIPCLNRCIRILANHPLTIDAILIAASCLSLIGSPGLNRYRNEVTFPSNSFTLCWTYDNNDDSDDGNDNDNDNDNNDNSSNDDNDNDDDVDYHYHNDDSNDDDVNYTLLYLHVKFFHVDLFSVWCLCSA